MEIYESINKRFMKDIDTDIISNGERFFVITYRNWDGYSFLNCFEISKNLIDIINPDKKYIAKEKYEHDNSGGYIAIGYEIEEA